MNDIDSLLNSVGLSYSSVTAPAAKVQETPSDDGFTDISQEPEEEVLTEQMDNDSNELSDNDFSDILQENGYSEPTNEPVPEEVENLTDNDLEVLRDLFPVETEEIENAENEENENESEEGGEEYNENIGEANSAQAERDLDAEEDADWTGYHPVNVSSEPTHSEESVEEPQPVRRATRRARRNRTETNEQTDPNALETNSPSLLIDQATSRFSGTEWYNEIQKSRIILAGLGGIGSWTALQLARMSPASLVLYDDDIVESANMSGQLYCTNDFGRSKVDAMQGMINFYTTCRTVYAINERFELTSPAGDIMICGFDNMTARQTFFKAWLTHVSVTPIEERNKCLFIDGRLSIDTLQVFCMRGDDDFNIVKYQNDYLFDDSQADETVCSMKQTTYLACMIGSVITNLFTNFIANSLDPIIPYDLPFFTEYDSQNMIFKTIK